MTKAKELARAIRNTANSILGNRIKNSHNFAFEVEKFCDAVLSEPEPLKGWIEVTFLQKEDLENVSGKGFIDVKTIQMCSFDPINQKSGITFHHAPDTCFHVQESYDEIKQKIKEAS